MQFIDFQETNRTFGPPQGKTEEDCQTIRALEGRDDFGPYVLVCFQPSLEDINAITAGRQVWVKICGVFAEDGRPTMMPIAIYTADENGEPNV